MLCPCMFTLSYNCLLSISSSVSLFLHLAQYLSHSRKTTNMCSYVININFSLCESCSVASDPCDPMDYTVHGILQARIVEWVAFPFTGGSSQPRDRTQVFHTTGGFFTSWAIREALIWVCSLRMYVHWLTVIIYVTDSHRYSTCLAAQETAWQHEIKTMSGVWVSGHWILFICRQ